MQLYYENGRGERLDLLNARGYALTGATGLASLPQNNITTVETVVTEGESVSYRRRGTRQIVLTHKFVGSNVKRDRLEFVGILDQGASGRLVHVDERGELYIDVEVETCEVSNTEEGATTATTTFLAPFPYFRDAAETAVLNKAVTGGWEFPFTFPVTFGSMGTDQSMVIENDGDFTFGFTLRISANGGSVSNPKVTNHEGKVIAFEREAPIADGQTLEVVTVSGSKGADLIAEDGTRQNVFRYLTGDTELFPLEQGTNVLMATAATGAENMDVEVTFRAPHKAV